MSANEVSILIVDDDESTRTLLEYFLSKEYRCETAANVEEAIGLLAGCFFNLVLTDLNMPGASGLEICQTVRRSSPETMVVIMSAMSDRQNKTEALQQGAFDYVTKPFDLLHIKKVIKDALLLGNH